MVFQVRCGILAIFVGTRVNGQFSASVRTLKPLSSTYFRLAGRSEDARWILDARSEIGNHKGAPVKRRLLFPNLPLCTGEQRNQDDGDACEVFEWPAHDDLPLAPLPR
jgi:hypothetical protein